MATRDKELEILLVEDNSGDVLLTKEALEDTGFPTHLNVTETGEAAMAFLRRERPYGNAPRPDLILLDLNLPGMDGREVLTEIKKDNHLSHIPVVVLTSSQSEADVFTAYDLHANCYISKPAFVEQFMSIIKSIDTFWSNTSAPTPTTPSPSASL